MLPIIARALASFGRNSAGDQDIELTVNTAQLRALAEKVKRLGPNNPHVRQGLTIIGNNWVNRIKSNFRRSVDPYGNPWAPIHHRQGQPLIDTGALRNSIKAEVRGGGLKEQVQQSVNFLSLLSETIPLPKHRYQWASDRTELT